MNQSAVEGYRGRFAARRRPRIAPYGLRNPAYAPASIQISEDGDFLRVLAETAPKPLLDIDADSAAGVARPEGRSQARRLTQRLTGQRARNPAWRARPQIPGIPFRSKLLSSAHSGTVLVQGLIAVRNRCGASMTAEGRRPGVAGEP
jgi:hypothetical protein